MFNVQDLGDSLVERQLYMFEINRIKYKHRGSRKLQNILIIYWHPQLELRQ